MPTIWDVMREVRGSDLPATDRHIVMTLASLAEPETAEIPRRYMPSLTELARFTGLGRSTVARRMPFIEDAGWLKRVAPPVHAAWRDKERTAYTLLIPTSPTAGLVPERDQSTSPTAGLVLVPERDRLVPERDGTSPAAGHVLDPLTNNKLSSSSDKPRKTKTTKKTEPVREDVERICRHLADRIESNGSKRPNITATWRREARLLLDEKRPTPVTVDKVTALIDWCQDDSFWRTNIRSMPKFRAQYDALRLRALAEYESAKKRDNGGGHNDNSGPGPRNGGAIPADERCPQPGHRGQRSGSCRMCRADQLAARSPRRTA